MYVLKVHISVGSYSSLKIVVGNYHVVQLQLILNFGTSTMLYVPVAIVARVDNCNLLRRSARAALTVRALPTALRCSRSLELLDSAADLARRTQPLLPPPLGSVISHSEGVQAY
eukprot:SAG11_NODE_2079_length_3855_cov_1.533280_3_plen_114_part_00